MNCELKLKRIDRKDYFTSKSTIHPAKMNLSLCWELIKMYSKPGDTILDPMSGEGTTGICVFENRNYIGIEFEPDFVKMQIDNMMNIEAKAREGLFVKDTGDWLVIHGDARNNPIRSADVVLTSPPYGQVMSNKSGGATSFQNIGVSCKKRNYSKNSENLGNMKYGKVDDVILSSPLCSEGLGHGQTVNTALPGKDNRSKYRISKNSNNVSMKIGKTYLNEMLKVYAECFRVLKPGGLMILVLKNYVKKKKLVRLDLDTRKLCEEAIGFKIFKCIGCNGTWDGGHTHLRKLEKRSLWVNQRVAKLGEGCIYDIWHEIVQVYEKPAT
jgi:DNA modification methylase